MSEIELKESNPKEASGDTKCPLALVPDTIDVEVAMAYLEGALKYGRYNWRIKGVRASTYVSAAKRHLSKWFNGQECDPLTKVKHLANAIACIGIILDADLCGKLEDDRPPSIPIDKLMEDQKPLIEHLKKLYGECNPKQYTIADSENDQNDYE